MLRPAPAATGAVGDGVETVALLEVTTAGAEVSAAEVSGAVPAAVEVGAAEVAVEPEPELAPEPPELADPL